ncbi:MAG: ATP-binding protein [Pseudomonadales bacterium]|nr:ATP-binding protein [Pseudomonadales bacterium]
MTFHPAILPFVLSAIVMASMAAYGYFRRDIPAAKEFSWLMIAQTLWVVLYILELISPGLEAKVFWVHVKYFVAPATNILWLVLCIVLTDNRRWLTPTVYRLGIGWSVTILILALTNNWHGLFWNSFFLEPGQLEVSVVHGSLYPLYSVPALSLVPASIVFFAVHSRKARFYRNRSIILIFAALLPAIGWFVAQSGVRFSIKLDPVVLGLCVASMVFAIAVFQFRVLDVLRVAQRLVIENINVGMIVVNHDRKVLGINPHAMAIFPTAKIGDQLDNIIPESKETELDDGDEWEYYIAEDCGKGEERYYLVRISEIANDRVGRLGYALMLLDISERKAAEKATRESMEAKTRFFANVSHELRTPLHGISGLLELLKRTDLDKQQQDYVDKAMASAGLLQTLIDDVLDISRIESERLEFELAPFSLHEVVENIRSVIGANATQKGLDFVVEVDPLDKLIVGDSLRLTQVLTNLTGNAVKFTREGHVKLVVRVVSVDESEAKVEFSVADTGIGIPAEQQKTLFHAFSQVDSSTTRQFGGTGLGLAISQQLVTRMGSEIQLISTEGQGSLFLFILSFQLADQKVVEEAANAQFPTDLSGLRVLVVDDSHVNQQVAEELLERAGVEVQLASNGREAIEAVRANEFDGVLMDVQMPIMDGHAATRLLRYDFTPEQLPIIAMTASAFDEDRQLAREAGMTDFIVKPFQPHSLYSALQRLGERVNAQSVPVIDANGAVERFNGDEALYKRLLKDLASETNTRLSRVNGSTSEDEFKQIVHGIKGSAGMVGASELAACAHEIEHNIQQGRVDIEESLSRLSFSVARLMQST